jgi:hypothetical protein
MENGLQKIALKLYLKVIDPEFDVAMIDRDVSSVRQEIERLFERIKLEDHGMLCRLYFNYVVNEPLFTENQVLAEFSQLPKTRLFRKLEEKYRKNKITDKWIDAMYRQANIDTSHMCRLIDILATIDGAFEWVENASS